MKRNKVNLLGIQFTLLLILFLSTASKAQKGSLHVMLNGTYNRSWIYNPMERSGNDLTPYTFDEKNGAGIIIKHPTYIPSSGVLLRRGLAHRIDFCYGLQFVNYNQRYDIYIKQLNSFIYGQTRLSYIELPLLIHFKFVKRSKFNLFVNTGPHLAMLVLENGGVPVYNSSTIYFNVIDATGVYKNFSIVGSLGLGGEYNLNKKFSLFIQAKAQQSLTNIEDKSFMAVNNDGKGVSNIYHYKNNYERKATRAIAVGISIGLAVRVR